MFRGLSTIVYTAPDVPAAVAWYADLLGTQPYFARPSAAEPLYAEFRIGDRQAELGIMDRRFAVGAADHPDGPGPTRQTTYWAVDDLEATYAELLRRGATEHEPPTERGPGFVTASVVDPFGNVVGVMRNEHYLEMNAVD